MKFFLIASENELTIKVAYKHRMNLRSAYFTLDRWMTVISICTQRMNQEATMGNNCNLFFLPCPQPGQLDKVKAKKRKNDQKQVFAQSGRQPLFFKNLPIIFFSFFFVLSFSPLPMFSLFLINMRFKPSCTLIPLEVL